MNKMDGALKCARYAFAPNFYHYCGPDTEGELGEYMKMEVVDKGLIEHLTNFEVMYPYLQAIAQANGVADPLDMKVVDAYWVGNKMLEKVTEQDVYIALTEKQRLPMKIPSKELKWLLPKIDKKARLHHSFHVLNVFTRTGHHTVQHTVKTMDECRISWGQLTNSIIGKDKTLMKIKSQKLKYKDGKLMLVPITREVILPSELMGERIRPNDWVSVHWGYVCDKLNLNQVAWLEKYTQHHIQLANESL